jgi:hypothetical protein
VQAATHVLVDKIEIAIARTVMINLIKKWLGIDKILAEKENLEKDRVTALARAAEATAKEEQAKLTPKERATARGEPWVAVLDTHVNKDNIRNGFFELDWNEEFVVQLKQAGYGFDGDPDEEIVDRWFRDLAANMLAESGQDPARSSAGFINVSKIGGGRAVVE